jgi:tetratricopeptide (TPR) repeat protein
MDLLDFDVKELYFDEPTDDAVYHLIYQAAQGYSDGLAEQPLAQAYTLAPENLSVLVARYRFFYYQHRYEECLQTAQQAIEVARKRLNFPAQWQDLQMTMFQDDNMVLARFYLMGLKGMAYLHLRLGNMAEGQAILEKILSLDPKDRLGAAALLEVCKNTTIAM